MKNITYKILAVLIVACTFSFNLSAQKGNTLKLISYNVYWGMRQDSTENKSKFAEWFKAQDADIVALQEVNGFTQKMLQDFAESYGHPYSYIVKEPEADGSISFPVALTSKYPIINVQRVRENMIHGLLIAEIEGRRFMVTHFHPFSAVKRGHEIDLVLANAKADTNSKWLLMGDLNSVSPLDRSEYDNNLVRDFIREDRKKRPHNENLLNNELDYSVQQKVLNTGFVDAFKHFHPKFEASAPTKLFYDQSKHPLRYDYLYVSSNMKNDLVKCEIMKDAFTDVYSDHYPVLLIFKK